MTDQLVDRVRQRLATGGRDLNAAVRVESEGVADDRTLARLARDVSAELVGAGPLEELLELDDVTDVLVNGADEVWIDRGKGMERTTIRFADDDAVRRLAQRLSVAAGRRLDDASPFVDLTLPDGTRLHAVLPPIAEHPTLSLRVLTRRRFSLDDLVLGGSVSAELSELLVAIIAARLAFIVTGGTGTGKTTLLSALLGLLDPSERVVVIEDSREIAAQHPHVVSLTARVSNVEGAGAVGLGELVRQALRMRPDRIVVGEFRGAEMMQLLAALNTGHEGGAATLHVNSPVDVPARLAALGALANFERTAVDAQLASGVDCVVHVRRGRAGRRVVAEVGVVASTDGRAEVRPAWTLSGPGSSAAELARRLDERGVRAPAWLR